MLAFTSILAGIVCKKISNDKHRPPTLGVTVDEHTQKFKTEQALSTLRNIVVRKQQKLE